EPASPWNADSPPKAHYKVTPETLSLPFDAVVPIYDATGVSDFNIDTDINRLAESLPPWSQGEVPRDSFVVVGYTLSEYLSRKEQWVLSCNLLWVIVIAVPRGNAPASPL
ncbi:hypothetical protein CVT24_010922, partial [Panaeolus cyanescens]